MSFDITITHFINPHLFWYKSVPLDGKTPHDLASVRTDVENYVRGYFRRSGDSITAGKYEPTVGHMVAAFSDKCGGIWIRGHIDFVGPKDEQYAIVWALDYGRPYRLSAKDLVPLPMNLQQPMVDIRMGGLHNCIPLCRGAENTAWRNVLSIGTKWSENSVQLCQQLVSEATRITFRPTESTSNGHGFGELICWVDNKRLSVEDQLIEMSHAAKSVKWLGIIKHLKTTTIARFEQNDGRTYRPAPSRGPRSRAIEVLPKVTPKTSDNTSNNISMKKTSAKSSEKSESSKATTDSDSGVILNGGHDGSNHKPGNLGQRFSSKFNMEKVNRVFVDCPRAVTPLTDSQKFGMFRRNILTHLQKNPQLRATHAYTWPHVANGGSLILIDDVDKQYAYLPALCSIIENRPRNRPKAVIVCTDAKQATEIATRCKQHLQISMQCNTVLLAAGGDTDVHELMAKSKSDCMILVTTVPWLLSLLRSDPSLYALDSIRHLVFNDFNILECSQEADVVELWKFYFHREIDAQVIITSKYWSTLFRKPKDILPNVMVAFNGKTMLEILPYAGCKLNVEFVSASDKIVTIADHAKKLQGRTIIICNTNSELDELQFKMFLRKVNPIRLHDIDIDADIELTKWHNNEINAVLVCTGSRIESSGIRNANNVIHYSLPETFEEFGRRYMAASDVYRANRTLPCTSTIVLAIKEPLPPYFFKELKVFMSSHRYTDALSSEESSDVEDEPDDDDQFEHLEYTPRLCTKMLFYGNRCRDESMGSRFDCTGRHRLFAHDRVTRGRLTEGQRFRVDVLKVQSPVQFKVRILEYMDPLANWQRYVHFPRAEFEAEYAAAKSMVIKQFHVGTIGVVRHKGVWQRCRMLKRRNDMVKTKLIDLGELASFKLDEIHALHRDYQQYPPGVHDVIIGGILPNSMSSVAQKTVENWIQLPEKDRGDYRIECQAIVHLQIELVVGDVQIFKHDQVHRSVREELIRHDMAQVNAAGVEHVKQMKRQFDAGGAAYHRRTM